MGGQRCSSLLKGYISMVKLLLEMGADVNARVDGHQNALEYAKQLAAHEIIKILSIPRENNLS